MKFHNLTFLFMIVFASQNALACTLPDGEAGDVLFNADHAVLQFCNGTSWIGMGGGGGGAQIWSQDGDDIHYNDGNVGIGTDSPAATLDVDGNIEASGNISGNQLYTTDVSGGRWCQADADGRIRCNQAEPDGGGWSCVTRSGPSANWSHLTSTVQCASGEEGIRAWCGGGGEVISPLDGNSSITCQAGRARVRCCN